MFYDEATDKVFFDEVPVGVPLYHSVIMPYLRRFMRVGVEDGDSLMPADRRLIRAIRAVYDASDAVDRTIMRLGLFNGTVQEQKRRKMAIVSRIAIAAGLCSAGIILEEERQDDEESKD